MYYIISDDNFFSYGLSGALKEKQKLVSVLMLEDVLNGKIPEYATDSIVLVDTECCQQFMVVVRYFSGNGFTIIPVFDVPQVTLGHSCGYGYLSKKGTIHEMTAYLLEFAQNKKYKYFSSRQELVIKLSFDEINYHRIAKKMEISLKYAYHLKNEAIKASGMWPINSRGVRYLYQLLCRNEFR